MTDDNSLNYNLHSPIYNGYTSFEGFWLQFCIFADRFQWTNDDMVSYFCLSLRDKALEYYANLPVESRNNILSLHEAFKCRFGDVETPEMYRMKLQNICKTIEETIQEYVCRVQLLVWKSFPGIDENLHVKLTTEYVLLGYGDSNIAFRVMIKQPSTVYELINEILWQQLCKENYQNKSKGEIHNREDRHEKSPEDLKQQHNFSTKKGKTVTNRIKCSRCKSRGHVRRTCPGRKCAIVAKVVNVNADKQFCTNNVDCKFPQGNKKSCCNSSIYLESSCAAIAENSACIFGKPGTRKQFKNCCKMRGTDGSLQLTCLNSKQSTLVNGG